MLRARLLLRAQEELEEGEEARSSQEPEPELELKLFLLKEQQLKKLKR